jgi:hypothetical protein
VHVRLDNGDRAETPRVRPGDGVLHVTTRIDDRCLAGGFVGDYVSNLGQFRCHDSVRDHGDLLIHA